MRVIQFMDNLLTYLHSLTPLSHESMEALLPILIKRDFKKGDFLLKEGEVCNSLFFIDKGYCRSYRDKDGTEKNTAFYFEGEIATNLASFSTGERSDYFIQACEPLVAIIFSKQELFELSRRIPEIEALGRACLRLTASRLEEHADLFKLYTPTERYQYLEQHRPDMLQRVSLSHLSSYLGIARETLSRIRKRRFAFNR
ncbi:MAG: Crp/Fnr family transcriptional regulator [Mangrovibacterium sp.]